MPNSQGTYGMKSFFSFYFSPERLLPHVLKLVWAKLPWIVLHQLLCEEFHEKCFTLLTLFFLGWLVPCKNYNIHISYQLESTGLFKADFVCSCFSNPMPPYSRLQIFGMLSGNWLRKLFTISQNLCFRFNWLGKRFISFKRLQERRRSPLLCFNENRAWSFTKWLVSQI